MPYGHWRPVLQMPPGNRYAEVGTPTSDHSDGATVPARHQTGQNAKGEGREGAGNTSGTHPAWESRFLRHTPGPGS